MKKKFNNLKVLTILIILILSSKLIHAQVAINTDGTSPDPAAMLDVKSTDKGMLVPRMTTTQRTAISTLADGLLVYDTNTKSFWFYNNAAWAELINNNNFNELADADKDTKIEVDRNGLDDDKIYFSPGGVTRWTMEEARLIPYGGSSVFIGSSSGYNYSGGNNIGIGFRTLQYNSSGQRNIAIGYEALRYNEAGYNSAYGYKALNANTTGQINCAFGDQAMMFNETGSNNAAFGNSALFMNTEGDNNSAMGLAALNSNTLGSYNTAVGAAALKRNTTGFSNVAIGIKSLYENTIQSNLVAIGDSALFNNGVGASHPLHGVQNIAIGSKAMYSNTLGYENTAIGFNALYSNTEGSTNTAVGYNSLYNNTIGDRNTGIGDGALMDNTTGDYNTAIGSASLVFNTTGQNNTSTGMNTMYSNTTGNYNTAYGSNSLGENTSGSYNTAIGHVALYDNTTGGYNVGVGYRALGNNTTGHDNTALGKEALYSCNVGFYNTAIGMNTMHSVTSGDYNTALGHYAYYNGNYTNSTALGDGAVVTASNQVRVGYNVTSIGGPVAWTNLSDGRFKTDIQENVPGLEFIQQLRPVTYHFDADKLNRHENLPEEYLNDPTIKEASEKFSSQQFTGFIAQEVEEAASTLNYNFSGVDKPENPDGVYGLRYAEFVVPMVKAIQEQQFIIEELQQKIEQLENNSK